MKTPKQRVMEQLMACAILRASSKTEDDSLVLPSALDEFFFPKDADFDGDSGGSMRMMLN